MGALQAIFVVLGLILAAETWGYGTGLDKPHTGVSVGAGALLDLNQDVSAFDPLSAFENSSIEIQGSEFSSLRPIRMGFFTENSTYSLEFYGIYLYGRKNWLVVSDNFEGTGRSSYQSFGLGSKLGLELFTSRIFRISLVGLMEYYWHHLELQYTPEGADGYQPLGLSTNNYNYGWGLEPELWLGDMWRLSFLAAYVRSGVANWSVDRAEFFIDKSRVKGELLNNEGATVGQKAGGLLLQLAFKLSFY